MDNNLSKIAEKICFEYGLTAPELALLIVVMNFGGRVDAYLISDQEPSSKRCEALGFIRIENETIILKQKVDSLFQNLLNLKNLN